MCDLSPSLLHVLVTRCDVPLQPPLAAVFFSGRELNGALWLRDFLCQLPLPMTPLLQILLDNKSCTAPSKSWKLLVSTLHTDTLTLSTAHTAESTTYQEKRWYAVNKYDYMHHRWLEDDFPYSP